MSICLTLVMTAALAAAAEPVPRVATTVRADVRTGRLVRGTVVASQPVASRQLAPRTVAPKVVDDGVRPAAPPAAESVNEIIEQASRSLDVDPLLVHSLIRVESNYNPLAVSPKGAAGIMQLIPATARRFGVVNSFDVRDNITAGVKYLKYLQEMFKDDRLALAAYNAGEAAVAKYGDVPPYRETEQYVYQVGKAYGAARKQQQVRAVPAASAPKPAATPAQPAPEPLRGLDVSTDAGGRVVLRTR